MLIELVMLLIVGVASIWIGLLIWKKEKISLIHSYHHAKVKNKKAYTTMMGKGITTIDIGCIFTGSVDYVTQSVGGRICFGCCFVVGFILMSRAQKRYNGGFF